jgi:hypothetical protein
MTEYELGYEAGRNGVPCEPESPEVHEWFAAGWYDGKSDRLYLLKEASSESES